jgi:hypothetical protein
MRSTLSQLAVYKKFLTLWKGVDPDIPILKEAQAEYVKLQQRAGADRSLLCGLKSQSADRDHQMNWKFRILGELRAIRLRRLRNSGVAYRGDRKTQVMPLYCQNCGTPTRRTRSLNLGSERIKSKSSRNPSSIIKLDRSLKASNSQR